METCVCCGTTGSVSRCSRCKAVSYCSRECQKKDWKSHKSFCRQWTNPADWAEEGEPEAELQHFGSALNDARVWEATRNPGIDGCDDTTTAYPDPRFPAATADASSAGSGGGDTTTAQAPRLAAARRGNSFFDQLKVVSDHNYTMHTVIVGNDEGQPDVGGAHNSSLGGDALEAPLDFGTVRCARCTTSVGSSGAAPAAPWLGWHWLPRCDLKFFTADPFVLDFAHTDLYRAAHCASKLGARDVGQIACRPNKLRACFLHRHEHVGRPSTIALLAASPLLVSLSLTAASSFSVDGTVVNAIATSCLALRALRLAGCEALDDAAIAHLCHPKAPRLRWLDLSGCAPLLTLATPCALGRSKLVGSLSVLMLDGCTGLMSPSAAVGGGGIGPALATALSPCAALAVLLCDAALAEGDGVGVCSADGDTNAALALLTSAGCPLRLTNAAASLRPAAIVAAQERPEAIGTVSLYRRAVAPADAFSPGAATDDTVASGDNGRLACLASCYPGLRSISLDGGDLLCAAAMAAAPPPGLTELCGSAVGSRLRHLSLARCKGVGNPAALGALARLPGLRELDLSMCLSYVHGFAQENRRAENTAALIQLGKTLGSKLHTLDLANSEESRATMVTMLEPMPSLCSLGLAGCTGGAVLAASLNRTELPSLHRDFEVWWNEAGAASESGVAMDEEVEAATICSLQNLSVS